MGKLELIKCVNCGGSLDGAKKESDILLICPYCGGKNYINPSYSFYKDLVKTSLENIEDSVKLSLEIGKLEKNISQALDSENIKLAIEEKGKLILVYERMNPAIKTEEEKKAFFKIEMHRFKKERLTEQGKSLKAEYEEAIVSGNLLKATQALMNLEFYKIKGCDADYKLVNATREGILQSAKYFIKGFANADRVEKERVLNQLGLDEGLIKIEGTFRCPTCGGEVTPEQKQELTQCPYCDNIFQKSGIDELADAMGFAKGEGSKKGEIEEMMENTQLTKEQVKRMQDAAKEYIEIPEVKIDCPFCGAEITITDPENIVCPKCKKSLG